MALRALLVLAGLVAVCGAGCTTRVQHGLDESAANEIVSRLERAGIGAAKVRDEEGAAGGAARFAVRVASGDAVRALDTLQALGLPRGRRAGFAEVYAQPSLVPTSTEERARYVAALAGEIERTFESVDGVVSARVHLVLAEVDPLAEGGKPRVPAQAAVLIKARPGATPVSEADVQRLVAGSVPGLQPAAVAVVMTASSEPPGPSGPPLAALGPLRVSPGTRAVLITGLVLAVVVLAALSLLLLHTSRRLASLERRAAGPES